MRRKAVNGFAPKVNLIIFRLRSIFVDDGQFDGVVLLEGGGVISRRCRRDAFLRRTLLANQKTQKTLDLPNHVT